MNNNTKIIAVLTEDGDLNILTFDVNHVELTMEDQGTDDENEALEVLLSGSYDLSSIQWQEIKGVNLRI